ncbi:MAG: hypothetical protein LKK25_04000, partial [Sphaerochaeta sp.]|nr:hypothetical protein [Sphaerochaeta sp.]
MFDLSLSELTKKAEELHFVHRTEIWSGYFGMNGVATTETWSGKIGRMEYMKHSNDPKRNQ